MVARRSPKTLEARLKKIRLVGLDVDGVLTDGGIFLGDSGDMRRFDSRDGVGIKLLQHGGLHVAIVSGRKSESVARRATELGIGDVVQGTIQKVKAMREIMARHRLEAREVAFVGDDLPDVPMFRHHGVGFAVANACPEALEEADVVLTKPGGHGAVREAAEIILRAQGRWDELVESLYAGA